MKRSKISKSVIHGILGNKVRNTDYLSFLYPRTFDNDLKLQRLGSVSGTVDCAELNPMHPNTESRPRLLTFDLNGQNSFWRVVCHIGLVEGNSRGIRSFVCDGGDDARVGKKPGTFHV